MQIKGPNLNDLNSHYQKVVKPFIETPFMPTEVEKLTETNKKESDKNISMSKVQLIGERDQSRGSEVNKKFRKIEINLIKMKLETCDVQYNYYWKTYHY